MKTIKDGDVTMHSKKFFITKAALSIIGIIFVGLAILFLGSFVIFITNESQAWELMNFGSHGVIHFITSLPWAIVGIGLLLIGILASLIQKYRFAYHKPIIASVGIIVAVSAIGGVAIGKTSFHNNIENRIHPQMAKTRMHIQNAEMGVGLSADTTSDIPQKHLFGSAAKLAAPLYKNNKKRKPDQLFIGTITEIEDSGFEMETLENEEYNVIITDKTKKPKNYEPAVDDRISVFGKQRDATIKAFGIRPQKHIQNKKASLLRLRNKAHADEPPHIKPQRPDRIRK